MNWIKEFYKKIREKSWFSYVVLAIILALPAVFVLILSENCNKLIPKNTYQIGSGHYAGWEWAKEKQPLSCGGNSQSFIEGCEDYITDVHAHTECEFSQDR